MSKQSRSDYPFSFIGAVAGCVVGAVAVIVGIRSAKKELHEERKAAREKLNDLSKIELGKEGSCDCTSRSLTRSGS